MKKGVRGTEIWQPRHQNQVCCLPTCQPIVWWAPPKTQTEINICKVILGETYTRYSNLRGHRLVQLRTFSLDQILRLWKVMMHHYICTAMANCVCDREYYLILYFPSCEATRKINTKITLEWAHKEIATAWHYIYWWDDLYTSTPCLTNFVYVLVVTSQTFTWCIIESTIVSHARA